MARRTLYLDNTLQLEPWSAAPPPVSPLNVAVDAQRNAVLSGIPTGLDATGYEYQFRQGPTVNAQRQVDISQTLNAGESASDYEYQVR